MLARSVRGFVFAAALALDVLAADIVVRVAPPRPIVESRGLAPSREHVWIQGYHRYDRDRYVWVPGRWERVPRRHAHWVPHRWVRRNDGWVLVEGHWR